MSEEMNQYDKPFKTYEQLLELLESRNFIIDDKTFAIGVLKNISYYTLINGYYHIFDTEPGSDVLKTPVSFNNLYALHIIDSNFSNILFKYILAVERSLKSNISYIVSKLYGVYTDLSDLSCRNPDDYLCRDHYSRSTNIRNGILSQIKKKLNNRPNPITRHYKSEKNHIPPWIITYNLPFGLSIKWYSILIEDDKTYICDQLLPIDSISLEHRKELLAKSLSLLKEYRNSMAHGNRLFVSNINTEIPKNLILTLFPTLTNSEEYDSGISKNGAYTLILLFSILLNEHYMIENMLQDLHTLFSPYRNTTISGKTIFEIFNLPNDLLERLQIQ